MRLNEIREIPAVLQSQETFTLACFWTLLNLDLIQTWCDDRYCCTLYFDTITSRIDCDLHSRSQECGEAKTFVTIFLQSFEWNLVCRWDLLVWVWMIFTFIQFHSCMRKKYPFFSQQLGSWCGRNSVCCHNLFVYWSLYYFYFAQIIVKGEHSADMILWRIYMFNIIMCQDTCELICFKLGMMLNITKLYSFIPMWMTVMLTQGDRVLGKLELVKLFCCKQ